MRIILTNIFLVIISISYTQDIHFSQFYNSSLLINPATAGAFNGDLRANLNYRNQWNSIDSPFKTTAFSLESQMLKYKWPNNYLGVGLSFFDDKAGDLNFGSSQTALTVSSILSLSPEMTMTVGIQPVFVQYSVDYTNAMTSSQYNGSFYDPNLPSGETNLNSGFSFFDVGAGVSFNYAKGESNIAAHDMFIVNVGFAFHHLNRSELTFSTIDNWYPKLVAHGSSNIGLRYSKLSMMPSYLVMIQGPQKEITVGSLFRFFFKEGSRFTGNISESALLFGAHYRFGDAIVASTGMQLGELFVQLSYDINTSGLTRSTNYRGGFEITLRYTNPEIFSIGSASSLDPKFM